MPAAWFGATGPHGRSAGGLFSLDGVHPTTIAYGLMAQSFMDVMAGAGVVFYGRDGRPRPGPVQVDFAGLIARDTLISDPPTCITPDLQLLGWANTALDWVKRMGQIFSSA